MQRSLRLVLGGIALLLAASLAAPLVRSAPHGGAAVGHEAKVSARADAAVLARVLPGTDRGDRAHPLLLAVLVAAVALVASGWVRVRPGAPALVPVRVDRRRTHPVRGPPPPGAPHR